MSDARTAPFDRLTAVVNELRSFVQEREWSPFHDPKNLAMAVASEAGELVQELRWVRSEDADAFCQGPARAAICDEVGDVLITTLLFCERTGIDPIDAIRAKMQKNAAKYPANEARGQAYPTATKASESP